MTPSQEAREAAERLADEWAPILFGRDPSLAKKWMLAECFITITARVRAETLAEVIQIAETAASFRGGAREVIAAIRALGEQP